MGILHYLQHNTRKLGKIVVHVQAQRILDILKKCPCLILVLLCTCFEISTKMAASCKAPIQHDNLHKPPDDSCSHSRDCPEWLCPQAAYQRLKMKVTKKNVRHSLLEFTLDHVPTGEKHVKRTCPVTFSFIQLTNFTVFLFLWKDERRSGVDRVSWRLSIGPWPLMGQWPGKDKIWTLGAWG